MLAVPSRIRLPVSHKGNVYRTPKKRPPKVEPQKDRERVPPPKGTKRK